MNNLEEKEKNLQTVMEGLIGKKVFIGHRHNPNSNKIFYEYALLAIAKMEDLIILQYQEMIS